VNGAVIVCVVWFAVVIAVGLVSVSWIVDRPRRRDGAAARVSDVTEYAAGRIGRPATAGVIYFAGAGVILAIMWPLGRLAHVLEPGIDVPTFDWFRARQIDGAWSTVWLHLTNIGKPRITQGVAAVAAVGFAVLWGVRGRRWWVPLIGFPLAYFMVKYCQILLQDVVDRGHPPPHPGQNHGPPVITLGTYPSGGCARVIVIYGLVIFCALYLTRLRESRKAWIAAMTLTAVLLTVQAYARIYNLEHWVTDVIGGTLMGTLMLIVTTTCFRVLSPAEPVALPGSDTQPAGAQEQPERV
jgi:hypothetical protein